jgi:hypothetical protein
MSAYTLELMLHATSCPTLLAVQQASTRKEQDNFVWIYTATMAINFRPQFRETFLSCPNSPNPAIRNVLRRIIRYNGKFPTTLYYVFVCARQRKMLWRNCDVQNRKNLDEKNCRILSWSRQDLYHKFAEANNGRHNHIICSCTSKLPSHSQIFECWRERQMNLH